MKIIFHKCNSQARHGDARLWSQHQRKRQVGPAIEFQDVRAMPGFLTSGTSFSCWAFDEHCIKPLANIYRIDVSVTAVSQSSFWVCRPPFPLFHISSKHST